jgi:hypothetical protein
LRIDAPAAGDTGRGTVTDAVAAALSAVAVVAADVGCVGLLLFEHAAAARTCTDSFRWTRFWATST